MLPATTLSELEDQIRTRYGELSKRLQQVAAYVLDNKNSVAFETVSAIAEQANVPPSTLIRFANAFGYSGFNEMKQLFRSNLLEETSSYTDRVRLLKEMEGDTTPPERPMDILQEFARANSNAMHQLAAQTPVEYLDSAVEILAQAKNIYVVGLGRSFSVSSYLVYALRHLNKRAFLIDGLGGMFKEQMSTIEENDVLIVISFSPYAKETTTISESLVGSAIQQIIITDSQISPLASSSDVCFVVKEAKVDAFRSQAASLCLAQTLAVSLAFHDSANKE
ncbi:MurR/RpiR family transcriptional regulator [Vibrio cincinnatiensis]|jgi:DNA-binding MurR/RpiR family transcriptional regulator|uniref:Transcriptional regulator, RpiR family n=1 Tax=Vibrio cincinnatiensis DSM 19608 TaxID=1123491 RepID=A0A1T4LQA2_VIBCI|nr:MurR/RpiR family transcriptional regulator [Vibrio cincinnatiensis]MCG3722021.1 MurR/RpiR family transcriptional regulator [Vibrio cincinnatiensis]MCG3726487.1 MurR/RpiR family transcriptional regulator [Vibrio cincinnatiensis]MCG3732575.1 MurR/RpiR family transcriptional regulator [Vibrio cincinnatiensis]MCG3735553.1 MurR/RpiR family transcriptional regulator [Vibrio cincinnatiensis]MCG3740910.1 MurR/RpiR family transcriptional regulator [Vibrio cincinnatiensis]